MPWLHFTQIHGLVPLQLSSSCCSCTHPHTGKQVPGPVLPDHPRSVWSFLQRDFLARLINSTRSDFRSSSEIWWGWDHLTCPFAVGPMPLKCLQHSLASCRHLLLLFFCWRLWRGGSTRMQNKVSQAVVAVVRRYAENSPSAKAQGPEPSFLDLFCQFSYTFPEGLWRNHLSLIGHLHPKEQLK